MEERFIVQRMLDISETLSALAETLQTETGLTLDRALGNLADGKHLDVPYELRAMLRPLFMALWGKN